MSKNSPARDGGGSSNSNAVVHQVRAGESLAGIAARHKVSLAGLLAANPQITNPDLIRVGQKLNIIAVATVPAPVTSPVVAPVTSPIIAPVISPVVAATEASSFIVHIVKSGDTLSAIAGQRGVGLAALLAANPGLTNPHMISIGQQILIPLSSGVAPAPPPVAVLPPITTAPGNGGGATNAHAILLEFQPAGASERTARQDGLPQRGIHGVRASETMAKTDGRRVMQHKTKFEEAARRFALPPALLAAIASRESRGGAALDAQGEGDHGHGFGLMQVDNRNPFAVVREGGPTGQPHINQATKILRDKLDTARRTFPSLSPARQLQAAVSRYNGGRGLPPPDSDRGTTGNDYMNDVWARALFYARTEQWDDGGTGNSDTVIAPVIAPPVVVTPPVDVPAVAATFVPAPSLADVRGGRAVIERGQIGDSVRHVQLLLGVSPDRKFGSDTETALLNFQRGHAGEVAPDALGQVGLATLAALEQAGAAAADSVLAIDPRGKTAKIHPEFRRRLGLLAAALATRGMGATITDGVRTFAHQDAIFAQGRRTLSEINALRRTAGLSPIKAAENRKVTGVRGGFSNHNYGMAVDLYPVVGGKLFINPPADRQLAARFKETQQAIGEEAERIGLTWGGRWKKLVDTPHVQLFPLHLMRPEECHEIFRAHGGDLNAVWAEATRLMQ